MTVPLPGAALAQGPDSCLLRMLAGLNLQVGATCAAPPRARGQRVKAAVTVFESCPGGAGPKAKRTPKKGRQQGADQAGLRASRERGGCPNPGCVVGDSSGDSGSQGSLCFTVPHHPPFILQGTQLEGLTFSGMPVAARVRGPAP